MKTRFNVSVRGIRQEGDNTTSREHGVWDERSQLENKG